MSLGEGRVFSWWDGFSWDGKDVPHIYMRNETPEQHRILPFRFYLVPFSGFDGDRAFAVPITGSSCR